MNIYCVICSDLFLPAAEIYITQCGHMFHFGCLINWLERSKTCPQCRCKVTEKTIHRVYFNLANTDGITDDVATLQNKIENIQFQMTLKEKDLKIYTEKYKKFKSQNAALREEVAELEGKIRVHESAMHALKDQIVYFKTKSKECDRLSEEVIRLKNKIKDVENVQKAINSSREEVNEMLRNESNMESLALLAAILKKSLIETEKKKRDIEHNLKKAQNEATKYRRDYMALESDHKELKKELAFVKTNLENEKIYLKNKISELDKKLSSVENLDITNTSLKRIVAESPINFNKKPQLTAPDELPEEAPSPSLPEKVQKIIESSSPYLPVKSNIIGVDYRSIISNTKFQTITGPSKTSIFKPSINKLENVKLTSSNTDVVYNGMGGSSKEDIFPSPKPNQTGLKRPKSSSSITSSKFRKLAPTTTKAKVTNYFSQSSSQ